MNKALPSDYDVEGWQRFYAEHPGYRRSVGADGDNGDGDGDGSGAGGDGGGDGDGDSGSEGGATDDWRTGFVAGIEDEGERTKELTRLNRFDSQGDFHKSYRELEGKVTSGELVFPVDKGADDETVQRFREKFNSATGDDGPKIPLEFKDYIESLPDGIVVGENEQESVLSFAEAMHPHNMNTEQMGAAIKWLNEFAETSDAQQQEADQTLAGETEEYLRSPEQWGPEYKANMNRVNQLVTSVFGEEAGAVIHSARDPEGREIMSSPAILKGLLGMMRSVDPAAFVVPNVSDPNRSLDDEIAAIDKVMREDRAAYNADEKMQARYRDLIDARNQRDERNKQQA